MLKVEAQWNDNRRCWQVASTATHFIDVIPMLFNHRVVMTRRGQEDGYEHGWCYPDMLAAMAAVAAWDPDTEPEPVGYLKRATPGLRTV